MAPLDLQSEKYSNLGNISAEGIGKILGTPRHDRLQIVVRETVQNSWDARADGVGSPVYKLRLRTLTPTQQEALRRDVFDELPAGGTEAAPISTALGQPRLMVLEIADFGTSGLGGPVRADVVEEGEATDFVDFMRNIGSPRDTQLGGGTYGYGKTSLYRMSACSTILVHSRSRHGGRSVERVMGCRLGEPYAVRQGSGKGRYTGRHWWGRRCDDIVDPLERDEARLTAERLGLFTRAEPDYGTTLVILCPVLEDRTPRQAMNAVVESLLWFFWPKMVGSDPAMQFEVFLENERVSIPKLTDCPPLDLFEEAIIKLKSGGDSLHKIRCKRPKQELGLLSLVKGGRRNRRVFDTGEPPLIPEKCSHVALMRPVELVVAYLDGPALPSDLAEYAGVFICDTEVEDAFAKAEPPAHDDWVPDYLEGREKTYVRVAIRRIHEALRSFAERRTRGTGPPGSGLSFGLLGDSLGGLLIGARGARLGGRQPGPPSGGVARREMTVRGPFASGFDVFDGADCALFDVAVESRTDVDAVLQGKPSVVLFDGSASSSADGSRPEVKAWLSEDGQLLTSGPELRTFVVAGEEARYQVAVSLPGECKVKLSVSANESSGHEQKR